MRPAAAALVTACLAACGEAPKRATRRRLVRNLGGGRFDCVTDRAGFGDASIPSMAAPIGFDGDGFDDHFVIGEGPDRLRRNRGDLLAFEDVSRKAGVEDALRRTATAPDPPVAQRTFPGDRDVWVATTEGLSRGVAEER